jgi:hypothetical protein
MVSKDTNSPSTPPIQDEPKATNGGGDRIDVGPMAPTKIAKPKGGFLDKFKSKRAAIIANVKTLQGALPHYPISQAKDFVKLNPDEEAYWSPELCFVNVPVQGQKRDTLHLIDEEIALQFLPGGRIIRHRLALATKPYDVFFLCHVPSQNQDNSWNVSALEACEQAKSLWVQVTSRKAEGAESYKIDLAHDQDAFPDVRWPEQSLEELIEVTFKGRVIDHDEHPALLRLLGAKPLIK